MTPRYCVISCCAFYHNIAVTFKYRMKVFKSFHSTFDRGQNECVLLNPIRIRIVYQTTVSTAVSHASSPVHGKCLDPPPDGTQVRPYAADTPSARAVIAPRALGAAVLRVRRDSAVAFFLSATVRVTCLPRTDETTQF